MGENSLSQPLVIAHRGDSHGAPENTLPAFERAVALGVDFVELDYHESADGQLVVIHDDTLDRTTNARAIWGGEKIRVDSRSAADLARLDAGSWFGAKYSGAVVPTLDQVLEIIAPGARLAIERKAGSARNIIELLTKMALVERVVLQSFDWAFLAECHRLAPTLELAALGDSAISPSLLREISASGARIIAWDEQRLSREIVAASGEAGLQTWAWAVDDADRMRELAAWGAAGVITNDPATAKTVLR